MRLLTNTLVKDFEKDKQWILTVLSTIDNLKTTVKLREEPGEIVITLLMKQEEIEKAVIEAARKVFGRRVSVSNISVSDGGRTINLTFSSNCRKT